MLIKKIREQSGGTQDNPTVTLTISVDKYGNFTGYSYSQSPIELAAITGQPDSLTISLVVEGSSTNGNYYIYSYSSSPVMPQSTVPPSPGNIFQPSLPTVTLNFDFNSIEKDQTYLALTVINTKTNLMYVCDPQVGNDPEPHRDLSPSRATPVESALPTT